jgi:energy-coupling factor transport system permease protein
MTRVLLISYIPKKSYFHKLNPIPKLVIAICAIVLSFLTKNFVHNLVLFAFIVPLAYYSKLTKQVFKPIKYLFIIFVILFLIQGFFYPFREVKLIDVGWGFAIWLDGLLYAAKVASRLLVMLVYGYLFVLTTHPGDLVSALRKLKLPYMFGYVVLATLQIIPRVQSQMATIIEAQKSRGLETRGSIIKRLRAYTPLLGPLFMGSIQNVIERAMALEARAFSAKCEKTSYRETVIRSRDKRVMALTITCSIIFGVVSWLL